MKIIKNIKKYMGLGILAGIISISAACGTGEANPFDYNENDTESSPITTDIFNDSNREECHQYFFRDKDGDGYGDVSTYLCEKLPGYVENNLDCNDNDPNQNPGVQEECDGIDNNCNGDIDEGFPTIDWYLDKDEDGYGDDTSKINACAKPTDYHIMLGGDCDDTNPNINPGIDEICGNSIDDNCNGIIDENTISHQSKTCYDGDVYWSNSCGSIEELVENCTGNDQCIDDKCICVPDCSSKECGDDGCGDSCGTCVGDLAECIDDLCECIPDCYKKDCGDNGCGDSCGNCEADYECNEITNECECNPNCGPSLCCEIEGEKCLEKPYYNQTDYKCIPKNSVICTSDFGESIGKYCPPEKICVEDSCSIDVGNVHCCPPDKPHFSLVKFPKFNSYGDNPACPYEMCHSSYCSDTDYMCCDACYTISDCPFQNQQQKNQHCVEPIGAIF